MPMYTPPEESMFKGLGTRILQGAGNLISNRVENIPVVQFAKEKAAYEVDQAARAASPASVQRMAEPIAAPENPDIVAERMRQRQGGITIGPGVVIPAPESSPAPPVAQPVAPQPTYQAVQPVASGMRRFTAPPITPVSVTPVETPQVDMPDYSGAVDQLVQQATTVSRSPSFDARIASKQQRAAALGALREIGGMRGQDTNAAIQQAQLQGSVEQANVQRDFDAQRAAQDLIQRQAEREFTAEQDAQGLGMRAAQVASERDLAERRFGLDVAKALEASQRGAATYGADVAKAEHVAQQDLAKRQGMAQAFLARSGLKLDQDGNVVRPSSIPFLSPSVDENASAMYNAILQGVAPPATYLFPKQ